MNDLKTIWNSITSIIDRITSILGNLIPALKTVSIIRKKIKEQFISDDSEIDQENNEGDICWVLCIHNSKDSFFSVFKLSGERDTDILIQNFNIVELEQNDSLKNVLIDISKSEMRKKESYMILNLRTNNEMYNGVASLVSDSRLGSNLDGFWKGVYLDFSKMGGINPERSQISLTKIYGLKEACKLMIHSIPPRSLENRKLNPDIDFSIVITAYNDCNVIEACINSVIKSSTLYKLQIIVIDDGSYDKTEQKVQKYLERDNFRYIKTLHRGKNFARNIGLSVAVGRYIMFLDGNNIIKEQFWKNAEAMLLQNQNIDIFLGGREEIGYSSGSGHQIYGFFEPLDSRILDRKNFILKRKKLENLHLGSAAGKLYSNELIQKHSILFEESLYGDTLFNIELQKFIEQVYIDANVWFSLDKNTLEQYNNMISQSEYLAEKMRVFWRYSKFLRSTQGLTQRQKKSCEQTFWEDTKRQIDQRLVNAP